MITKELLVQKTMEIDTLWSVNSLIEEGDLQTVISKAKLVGRMEMINELINYLDETT
jgi:hypothetical protein